MLPLTGTTRREHMTEDLDSLRIELSESDVRTIESIAG
jgi:diketogulonate reductase-like aldo/keto reductase